MLHDGLYEQVISEDLNAELSIMVPRNRTTVDEKNVNMVE